MIDWDISAVRPSSQYWNGLLSSSLGPRDNSRGQLPGGRLAMLVEKGWGTPNLKGDDSTLARNLEHGSNQQFLKMLC